MIDAIFVFILGLAVFKGLRKGFVMAIFSMVSFIIGIALAIKLSAVTASYLHQETNIQAKWLPAIAFVIILIATIILINLGGKIIEKGLDLALLGWANKIMGAIFFVVLYCLLLSSAIFYLEKMHILTDKKLDASICYPYIKPILPKLMDFSGKLTPLFKDCLSELSEYFDQFVPKNEPTT
jgi:membrane protein required for colicin V production